MNERIKELAEQAGYDIKPFYKGEDNFQTPHFKDEKLEKFAELIVGKCLNIIDEEGCHEGGSIRSMEKIKEHFGIKE